MSAATFGSVDQLSPPLVNQRSHQSGPSRLVRGAQPSPVIAVIELVKQDEVPPVRVFLELLGSSIHGSTALVVARKDANHPVGDSGRHFGNVTQSSGIARRRHGKLRPIAMPEFA